MMKKELYAAPETEMLELNIENAVLIGSNEFGGDGQLPGWDNGGNI